MIKKITFVLALFLAEALTVDAGNLSIRVWNYTGLPFGQYGTGQCTPCDNTAATNQISTMGPGFGPQPNGSYQTPPGGTYLFTGGLTSPGDYYMIHVCVYGSGPGTGPYYTNLVGHWDGTGNPTLDWIVYDDTCPSCAPTDNCSIDDGTDGAMKVATKDDCEHQKGMADWNVSDPYVSLWLHDEPLGFQAGLGPRVSCELSFKQREYLSGFDTNIFSVGKKWNCAWVSYITNDVNGSNIVMFAGGGQRPFYGTNDYVTGAGLTGGPVNGFTLTYPDGSQDKFGFMLTNSSGVFQKAFLTDHGNAQGQTIHFNYASYNPASPVIRLQSIVDGDGLTTSIFYSTTNAYSTNLISQVVDPFGRSCSFGYDTNGHLISITDVAGITSAFLYDTNDWVTNLTTPYGTTTFAYTDGTGGTNFPSGRSIRVTEPDGSPQLYLHLDSAAGVASSYDTNAVPTSTPFPNILDNAKLNYRNTFHWNRQQYAYLSTTNIASFKTNDFRLAHMRHWLRSGYSGISETLSLEREPSPDTGGFVEGQKTWYDHAGKFNSAYVGTQTLSLFVGQVLPDGTTRFIRTERNTNGFPLNEVSTYWNGTSTVVRTNTFTYAANGIDLITVTNALGVQISSNSYNGFHQILTNFDALSQQTVLRYDATQRLASVTLAAGLVSTNTYFNSGTDSNRVQMRVEYELVGGSPVYYRTNSYTYTNGLVYTLTDPRGLTTTNAWDALQRLTSTADPRGSIALSYANLDLASLVDRTGFTNSFGYDGVRRLIAATNAAGVVTRYGYCGCGSLQSQTNAFGTAVQQVSQNSFDLQGNLIQAVGPDGYTVTYAYDALARLTNVADALSSVTNWYNNQGLLLARSNSFGPVLRVAYDSLDRATNVIDANGVTTTNTFDALNRLLTRGYPDGGIEGFGYSARGLTAYTNQIGMSNFVAYDALGRRTFATNANWQVTQFQYNPASDLTNLLDGKLQSTKWGIDQFGRVTNKLDATSTEILRFSYDNDNRLLSRWSLAKGTTYYTNDAVGNLLNVTYPQSANLSYSYDALNRPTTMVDAVGTTAYTYNNASQLLTEDGPWDSDTVSYNYNNRLRSSLSLPAPNASPWNMTYGWDAVRRLTNITSAAGAFSYQYDAVRALLPSKLTLPNGAYITNSFDSKARMTLASLRNGSGTTLDSAGYSYDQADQPYSLGRADGSTVYYTYDSIGQLVVASGVDSGLPSTNRLQEQFGYAYDAAGNLNWRTNNALVQSFAVNSLNELSTVVRSGTFTVAGTTTGPATNVTVNGQTAALYNGNAFAKDGFTLTDGNNSFTAIGQDSRGRWDTNVSSCYLPVTNSYVYDGNGNLRTNGTRLFDYDDENQLIRITEPYSWKSEFTYDGRMRRRIRREYQWALGTGPTTELVNGVTLGSQRNNFTGFVGFKFTVGNSPIIVTHLGRWVISGNTAAHTLKLVNANGTDVTGGSVTLRPRGQLRASLLMQP